MRSMKRSRYALVHFRFALAAFFTGLRLSARDSDRQTKN